MKGEEKRICEAVNEFSEEMKKKMLQKMSEGWSGWRNPKFGDMIRDNMVVHVGRFLTGNDEEYIDIANFCMVMHKLTRR